MAYARASIAADPAVADARGRRWGSIAAAVLVQGAIGYALLMGLGVAVPRPPLPEAITVALLPLPRPTPPPPPPRPRPAVHARRSGAAAPPNKRAVATPIVRPVPIVPVIVPPPVVAAPIAGLGAQASAGAAPVAGPGTGAGGVGNGTGNGRSGNGDGDGDGGSPLELVSRSLNYDDLPRALLREGVVGTVEMSFVVGVNGRVTSCTVTRSSGHADLDAATCDAAIKRLRYRPERDRDGHAVAVTVDGEQRWTMNGGRGDDDGASDR